MTLVEALRRQRISEGLLRYYAKRRKAEALRRQRISEGLRRYNLAKQARKEQADAELALREAQELDRKKRRELERAAARARKFFEPVGIYELRDKALGGLSSDGILKLRAPFFRFSGKLSSFPFAQFRAAGDLFFENAGGSPGLWRVESVFSVTLSNLTSAGYRRAIVKMIQGPGWDEGDEEPEAEE